MAGPSFLPSLLVKDSRMRFYAQLLLSVSVALLVEIPDVVGQGYSPDEAVSRMTVAEGFEVSLVAAEPLVRQPVCIEFDDRGRLWVIQYLQYPNPEGLRRVEVDRYSRTEYDRVPDPPPRGPRGADRITILTDNDDDVRMDEGVDFVNGLNLASGLAFGHGGVFVLNVPYLLFYPDTDRDDAPDTDPKVLLTGFGMQDAHSVANSLTWGPDGWLYGCQGSTVTSKIRGTEFQQGVWRYHVETDRFELFCEGGGNAWGLDFDHRGDLLYSTNYGGYVLVHGVQGGYFVKSFAKHGALHNPHTYGYLNHAPHSGFRGGHVTVGGLVYHGGSFPQEFEGRYIAGDLLGHGVYWHQITRKGSTVTTTHGDPLLQANDSWFAPTDVTTGPDGAIYVADWHDKRTAHPDPDADWDRTNGRIYRIAARDTPRPEPVDFAALKADDLLELHRSNNQWKVRRARQELVRRGDGNITARLLRMLNRATDERGAVEALWSLASLGQFDESLAMDLLASSYPAVRYWTLRLLGDMGDVSADMAHRLDEFAEQEPDVWVRQQLACTAKRLPARHAVPMINANINRDVDNDDPYLPLLWWWAVERHSVEGRQEVMRRFVRPTLWNSQLGRKFLLPRLIRRYAAEGTVEGLDSVSQLLAGAPTPDSKDPLWSAVLQGLLEESATVRRQSFITTHPLRDIVVNRWKQSPRDRVLQRLAIRVGSAEAIREAIKLATDAAVPQELRIQCLKAARIDPSVSLVDPLLAVIESDAAESVRIAALLAVAGLDDESVASRLIEVHQQCSLPDLQSQIRSVLLGRVDSARVWLEAVDQGTLPAASTPVEQIRQVALLNDRDLDQLVLKHWGRLQAASREEKLAEVRRLNNDLRAATGDPHLGRQLFSKHCATCHQLFGEGKKIGPDLTTANRSDRQALLISLVDPSSVIRREYTTVVIQTTDGRTLAGLPVSEDESGVTLVNNLGKQITVESARIEDSVASTVSLMPDDLYRQFTPQQLRDLFAWLQSSGPSGQN